MMPRVVALEERRELSSPVILRCEEHGCQLPVAEVRAGCLIIRSRHRGETHVAVLSLATIRDMIERTAA